MNDDLEFFFPELSEGGQNIPLPPAEMRFLELRAEPVIDDGPLRARVYLEVTPFQKRPFIEVVLTAENGEEIATVSVIEPLQRKNVFTIHIRGSQQHGKFALYARMYYPSNSDNPTDQENLTTIESDQAQAEFVVAV
ncbi:MAG: hypothetical protein RBS68_14780 [Anaerolineales bacterium]|jgi:hypothetical protein|nr:hypothetical protein [Anaerolineales bacterium]